MADRRDRVHARQGAACAGPAQGLSHRHGGGPADLYRDKVPDTYVTARTYLHPPGSGLDWHDDEGRFAGAYTYYVHPRWHASWGGELMIVEDVLGRSLLPEKRHMRNGRVETIKETWDVLTKDDLSQLLMDGATSTEFVFAKPNRLVFMVGGVWHRVNVAGFFLTEQDDTPFWR